MAVAAIHDRTVLGDAGFLGEARQGVVFAEEGDHRSAFAGLTDHGGGNVGDILGDAETLVLQFRDMLGAGARLGIADLGHAPDPLAQRDQALLVGIDMPPEVVSVVHDHPALVTVIYERAGDAPSSRLMHGGVAHRHAQALVAVPSVAKSARIGQSDRPSPWQCRIRCRSVSTIGSFPSW